MATLIKFKKGLEYAKKHPTVPITATSLGVATANYATNKRKADYDKIRHKEQLQAIENLTKSLNKVDHSLKSSEVIKKTENNDKPVLKVKGSLFKLPTK